MKAIAACPVCNGTNTYPVFSLPTVPVICNQLWPDPRAAASAPIADVDLQICGSCAYVWNASFDPETMVYTKGYENALHFSPTFQTFVEDLAKDLIKRFNLKGKHIVEIGCGDGYMLDTMVGHGVASGTGYDPSMKGRSTPFTQRAGVEIVPEYFDADSLDVPVDAIICRHVLEHLDNPMTLLRTMRSVVRDRDIPVYFEVPNAAWMLASVSMWDVIYEHVGYWSCPSIITAFRRAGFEPVSVREGYRDQFLMIEALPALEEDAFLPTDLGNVLEDANKFSNSAERLLDEWRIKFANLSGKAVIWGAGSKGITLANTVSEASEAVAALVDLNPRKHGMYISGASLPIVEPESLRGLKPDLVVISNAQYKAEIISTVRAMGLDCEIAIVSG